MFGTTRRKSAPIHIKKSKRIEHAYTPWLIFCRMCAPGNTVLICKCLTHPTAIMESDYHMVKLHIGLPEVRR